MNDTESFQRAKAAVLQLLLYRARSQAEVRLRLRCRFPSDVGEQVIQSLLQPELLNDVKFANVWKENRDTHRPGSAATIKRELISKSIPRNVAEAPVYDIDEQSAAYRAGLKFRRRLNTSQFTLVKRKLWGYLRRKGFSNTVIVLKNQLTIPKFDRESIYQIVHSIKYNG